MINPRLAARSRMPSVPVTANPRPRAIGAPSHSSISRRSARTACANAIAARSPRFCVRLNCRCAANPADPDRGPPACRNRKSRAPQETRPIRPAWRSRAIPSPRACLCGHAGTLRARALVLQRAALQFARGAKPLRQIVGDVKREVHEQEFTGQWSVGSKHRSGRRVTSGLLPNEIIARDPEGVSRPLQGVE